MTAIITCHKWCNWQDLVSESLDNDYQEVCTGKCWDTGRGGGGGDQAGLINFLEVILFKSILVL